MDRPAELITGLEVSMGSGLATLRFASGTHAYMEAGFGVRQLMAATNGHPIGTTIIPTYDPLMGPPLMAAFEIEEEEDNA